MKKFFGSIVSFFHRHPAIKSTAVAVGGAALTAASNGMFGPQAAVVAGAVVAVAGLFIRRPQDGAGQPPAPAQPEVK